MNIVRYDHNILDIQKQSLLTNDAETLRVNWHNLQFLKECEVNSIKRGLMGKKEA